MYYVSFTHRKNVYGWNQTVILFHKEKENKKNQNQKKLNIAVGTVCMKAELALFPSAFSWEAVANVPFPLAHYVYVKVLEDCCIIRRV